MTARRFVLVGLVTVLAAGPCLAVPINPVSADGGQPSAPSPEQQDAEGVAAAERGTLVLVGLGLIALIGVRRTTSGRSG